MGKWIEVKCRNVGGRAYLVAKLQERGASRRRAVWILNMVLREMGLALRRGEYVECPFGYLMAEKRLSERRQPGSCAPVALLARNSEGPESVDAAGRGEDAQKNRDGWHLFWCTE